MSHSKLVQDALLHNTQENPLNSPFWIINYIAHENICTIRFYSFLNDLSVLDQITIEATFKRRKKPLLYHLIHFQRIDEVTGEMVIEAFLEIDRDPRQIEQIRIKEVFLQNQTLIFTPVDFSAYNTSREKGWDGLLEDRVKQPKIHKSSKKYKWMVFGASLFISLIVIAVLLNFIFASDIKYIGAKRLFEQEKYSEAITDFTELGDFKESESYLLMSRLRLADQYFTQEKYHEAYLIYIDLGDYEDSAEKAKESLYQYCLQLIVSGNYDQAIDGFAYLEGYQDTDQIVADIYYQRAISFYEATDYSNAMSEFKKIMDYKEAKKYYYLAMDNYLQVTGTLPQSGFMSGLSELYTGLSEFGSDEEIASRLLSERYWPIILKGNWKSSSGVFEFNVSVDSNGGFSIKHSMESYTNTSSMKVENGSIWTKSSSDMDYRQWLDIKFISTSRIEIYNHASNETISFTK